MPTTLLPAEGIVVYDPQSNKRFDLWWIILEYDKDLEKGSRTPHRIKR